MARRPRRRPPSAYRQESQATGAQPPPATERPAKQERGRRDPGPPPPQRPQDGAEFAVRLMHTCNQANVQLAALWVDACTFLAYAQTAPILIPEDLLGELKEYRDTLKEVFDLSGYVIGGCRSVISGEADDAGDEEEEDPELEDEDPVDPARYRG